MLSMLFGRSTRFGLTAEKNEPSSSKKEKWEGHVASSNSKGITATFQGSPGTNCAEEPKPDSLSVLSRRDSKAPQEQQFPEVKVCKARFWMLALFTICNLLNGMQWMQYTVVADITICYYGVDSDAVNWTANLYLIVYPFLVFPVSWFMDHLGMRKTLLVGVFCNCLSTIIQCMALSRDSFSYVLASQTIVSIGQVFILAGPPFVSALWFAESELSRACAVGVFGNQLGCALGFIFTPLVVVQDCAQISTIRYQKGIVAYTLTGLNLVMFLLVIATFKDKPEIPPSLAQAHKGENTKDFKRTLLNLSKNLHFWLLMIMYGLICGAYFAFATVLNYLILPHFPGKDKEIGWMGLLLITSGLLGSIIAGHVLDWKHKYKETSSAIFILTLLSLIAFTGLLQVKYLWVQFLTITVLGFFLTSYFPVGFEFGAEITYPEPESITGSLLNASTMLCGFIFSYIASKIVDRYGDIAANVFLCVLIFIGCVISVIIKCDFRRKRCSEDSILCLEQIQSPGEKPPDYESIDRGIKY